MNKLIYAIALIGMYIGFGWGIGAARANENELTLTWKPVRGHVIGYDVYYGGTRDRSHMQLLPIPRDLNLKAPAVEFNVLSELGALPGENVCFRVRAYSNSSAWDVSPPVCTIL